MLNTIQKESVQDNMEELLEGIIQKDGIVKPRKEFFRMPYRGTDKEGYPEVLMDSTSARVMDLC